MPRGRRARLLVAVVGGVLALLCLGGIGITFVLYDDATKIDRGTPDQVVSSYLRAALVQRSDAQAQFYVCDGPSDLSSVGNLRREIAQREEGFGVTVSVSWGSLVRAQVEPGEERVRVHLTIAGSSAGQTKSRRSEGWEFRVVDQDGWRVCGATKVG
ncbi:MAG TPA: hypothetical protein VFO77_01435 [Actinoplanes sp.]|nr:hypothetical protein [Actinoplanes sp.]